MVDAAYAAARESGRETVTINKNKEVLFSSREEFAKYVMSLKEKQNNRCNITGILMQSEDNCTDKELLHSLDRINSDGHYAEGNLQIVCRFINRWKSDADDAEFRRLITFFRSEILATHRQTISRLPE
jgi:hypothetical protein